MRHDLIKRAAHRHRPRDTPILLLDEATSALDATSEALIQDAIEDPANRTTLIITHRLATARLAELQFTAPST